MTADCFPRRFPVGAATAAYQIEGSPLADGAGASIWQRFSHDPRLMAVKGDTGDVACDHYNRMPADVALMKELGLKAYRFSVNWGRVLPEGIRRRRTSPASTSTNGWSTNCSKHDIEPLLTLHRLGFARGARRQGRLAQSRQRRLVRRLWIRDVHRRLDGRG